MFARALVVLLLILNLGVALWWITRDASASPDEVVLPAGAETLRLLREAPPVLADLVATAPPPSAPALPPPVETDGAPTLGSPQLTNPAAVATACRSFGPFADAAAAGRARAQLQPAVLRASLRDVRPEPKGWRVILPRLPDAPAAAAAAARLVEAGFTDHYRMPAGEDGRMDIALGRFGSEAAAQRHQAALVAAGFPVVAEPIGVAGQARYWVDIEAAEEIDVVALRRAVGATQAERIDCAVVSAVR